MTLACVVSGEGEDVLFDDLRPLAVSGHPKVDCSEVSLIYNTKNTLLDPVNEPETLSVYRLEPLCPALEPRFREELIIPLIFGPFYGTCLLTPQKVAI